MTQVKRCKYWRMMRSLRHILHPLHRFTYVTAHSPTLPPIYLRHSSFYSPSVAPPTSQALHLRHMASRPCPSASFSTPYIASPSSQALHLCHRRFIYVTAHSPTLPPIHLRHRSFYDPSFASPTSGTSRTSPGEPPMHRGMKKQSVVDQLVKGSY